ncbi:hypothetical protein D3C86_1825560 [compost metagenome]
MGNVGVLAVLVLFRKPVARFGHRRTPRPGHHALQPGGFFGFEEFVKIIDLFGVKTLQGNPHFRVRVVLNQFCLQFFQERQHFSGMIVARVAAGKEYMVDAGAFFVKLLV